MPDTTSAQYVVSDYLYIYLFIVAVSVLFNILFMFQMIHHVHSYYCTIKIAFILKQFVSKSSPLFEEKAIHRDRFVCLSVHHKNIMLAITLPFCNISLSKFHFTCILLMATRT